MIKIPQPDRASCRVVRSNDGVCLLRLQGIGHRSPPVDHGPNGEQPPIEKQVILFQWITRNLYCRMLPIANAVH